MPIYEYVCCECGNEFEELVFSQEETPVCPKCASDRVEKLMSACSARTEGAIGEGGLGPMPPMGGGCGSGG